jgi:anthranilate phosphoribosyltransferase
VRSIFDGQSGPPRDVVLANAAVALIAADRVPSPKEGVTLASAAIDEGRASALLERLASWTRDC